MMYAAVCPPPARRHFRGEGGEVHILKNPGGRDLIRPPPLPKNTPTTGRVFSGLGGGGAKSGPPKSQ